MFNIQKMMQQAQEMQTKMKDMQERFALIEIEGQSGGGMVKVTMNCKGEVLKLNIDPSVINPSEKEVMEDLIMAAINDAKGHADEKMAEETASAMEDLGLPSDVKLPF